MSAPEHLLFINGEYKHEATPLGVHDDDRDASAAEHLALTPFPSLTGLRPKARRDIAVVESYSSKVPLDNLEAAALRQHASPAAILQAFWAELLAAYTGIKDEISFLSILPTAGNTDLRPSPDLRICRYHEHVKDQAVVDRRFRCFNEHASNKANEDSNGNGKEIVHHKDGTMLDLEGLLEAREDHKKSEDGHCFSPRLATMAQICIFPSATGTLRLTLRASEKCINKDAAQLMLAQFECMLISIFPDPEASFNASCSHLESPQLSIANSEPTTLGSFSNLQSQFEDIARSDPQRIAIEFVNDLRQLSIVKLTYDSLNRRADILASHLQGRFGPLVDCIVPICMDRCPETYIAVLGILKAGGAWCPIDPSFPPRRRCDLISRASACALIINAQSPRDGIPESVIAVDINLIDWDATRRPKRPLITPDSLAYLIWTSGTTGAPKGVPIHHRAAVASMRALQTCIPADANSGPVRCLQFSQSTFDVFVQDLFYTWGVGGTLISADRVTMLSSFAETATRMKATHAHLTPAFAASVARRECPTLEVVTMIGEKLTTEVANDWSQDCRLYNTYGPAETTVVSTLRLVPYGDSIQSANVGYPMPSVSAFVFDKGEPVMKNAIGELAIGGPQLSKGYWNDSEKTKQRFIWSERLKTTLYMTGDVVRQLYDGSFEFVGRTDDLVKIQGIRIELSEIAFALRFCHPEVQQVDVHFLDRPDRPSKVIVAFLAAPRLGACDEDVITDNLGVEVAQKALQEAKTQLPEYMIPKIFLVLGSIPRTSSAKVDRAAIQRLYAEIDLGEWEKQIARTPCGDYTAVNFNHRETIIIEAISSLTGTLNIAMSRQSTLPSIGVDSIIATRLATELRGKNIDITVVDIFQSATLGDLLRHLSEGRARSRSTPFDISAFHHRNYKLLDPSLAEGWEWVLPALPLQESLISESLRSCATYWSHNLFSLDSQIDLNKLETAWKQVARCTDALRTAFLPVAEIPNRIETNATLLQLISMKGEIDFHVSYPDKLDLNHQMKMTAHKIAEKHQARSFADPPWAITIFVHESRNIMMLSIHHSIRDEASLHFIMKDLERAYLNSSDELLRQRHQLHEATSFLYCDNDQYKKDEKFWANALYSYEYGEETESWPELKLTSLNGSLEGTITCKRSIAKSYVDLEARTTSIGVTSVASCLRVVWGCVLLEYLELDKIVFGETWSPRNEASELADVVGPLVTVVPVPFAAKRTLRELLQQHMNFQIKSIAHYGVHPRVIRKLLRRAENEALYPAIFNFVPDVDEQRKSEDPYLWRAMDDDVGLSVEHAIALTAYLSKDNTLTIELTASKRYMDHAHLDLLAQQVDALFAIIAENPDTDLSHIIGRMPLDLLSTTHSPKDALHNTAWAQSPTEWVDHHASVQSEWLAAQVVNSIEIDNISYATWSYGQLQKAYKTVASLISKAGCTKQRIAVCLNRSLDVYATILAIMGTGNTYLPIAEDLPDERKLFLLKDSETAILFTTRALVATFSRTPQSYHTIFVEDINYWGPTDWRSDFSPEPTDSAYLLYTSGSTGAPKGVLVSRGNLMSFIEAISRFIGSHVDMLSLQGKGKWLGMASYAFDVHLLEMFFPWRHGMSTVTAPRALLLDNLEFFLQELKVTHASFVPSLVDMAGLVPANLPDLQYMSVGGERITKKAIKTWSSSHVVLANAYGPTEMTIGCCFKRVQPESNVRNIGLPLTHTVAHVLSFGTTESVLHGTSGELCLTGELVANGYHKRPDAKGFVEDFNGQKMYRTGDRVRLMADGSLEFLGRNDDQTKIRGQRIELGEVSEAVRSATEKTLTVCGAEAAAIVVQHPSLARPQLVAFISAQENRRRTKDEPLEIISFPDVGTAEAILAHCSNVLPSFMVPDHIIRLTSLPLVTISRKIDNKQLQKLFTGSTIAGLTSHEKATNTRAMSKAEETVRDVAGEVLGANQAKIEIDSNLFRLGLDSLNVIGLTIKLQKLGFKSTVSNIMKAADVEHIALLRHHGNANTNEKPVLHRNGDLKQSFWAINKIGYDYSTIATVILCLPLQETLVASSLNHEGEALYVNQVRLELSPDVDAQRLLQAWNLTARNHEILRTCFHRFGKQFVQVVLTQSLLFYDHFNPSAFDTLDFRQRQADIASEIIRNIEFKPPIRLMLMTSSSDKHKRMLLVSIHHALYDAESFAMILDEVHARYERTAASTIRTPITALVDYIESQNRQDAKAFWISYLADYQSRLLPTQTADYETASTGKILSTPLTRVEQFAASNNSTPASVLQALFGVVLAEMLRTKDVLFGTILSGRTVPIEDAHTILAPCITTIPQRVRLASDFSLKKTISIAQNGFVGSIEFQHTALRDIHRWVEAEKPLFDTIFSYTMKRRTAPWSHLWWEVESLMPSEFPLAVEITADQATDQLVIRCDYTTAFGNLERANAFIDRIEYLILSLVQDDNIILERPMPTVNGIHSPKKLEANDWNNEQKLIRDIIEELVGIDARKITRNASFFALGIDSIIAIQFAKRLRQHGIECSSADVMRYASIRKLTQKIDSHKQLAPATETGSARRSKPSNLEQIPSGNIATTYPCTPLQASMLTQTLGSDGSLYVHHHAIRLTADITARRMKKAWESLVAGTEILRTSFQFSRKTNSWLGTVLKHSIIAWTEHDPRTGVDDLMLRIKKRLVYQDEVDFERPPWAVDIVGRTYIISMHHCLYDGESLGLLFQDLLSLIKREAASARSPFSLAAFAIQEQNSETESYWARSLENFKGTRLSSSTRRFEEKRVALGLGLIGILEGCKNLGVTLQTLALLAYGKTHAYFSAQQDIVVGHIVRGRTLIMDADDIVGPLFNTVPVRVNLERMSPTNKEAAGKLQRQTGESQAYQHASLSNVQQAWREKIKKPDAELLDALFVFQKRATDEEDSPWTSVTVDDVDTAPTEYSTNFEFEQGENEVTICVNSRSIGDLDAFVQTFEQILHDIVEQPDRPATAFMQDLPSLKDNCKSHTDVLEPIDQAGPDSEPTDNTLTTLHKVLAKVSGIPEVNITSAASIFSLGLDSISAIQIAQVGRKEGLKINVADILQGRTVTGIHQRLRSHEKSKNISKHDRSDIKPFNTASRTVLVSDTARQEILSFVGLRDDEVEDVLPCLPGQSYHLATWLKSGRTLGEATFAYTCKETIDPDRLLDTWHILRERHSMLRTVLTATSSTSAFQVVLRPPVVRSDAFQYLNFPLVGRDRIGQVIKQEASRRFDLFSPPVELLLVRGQDEDYVILKLHHALYDAWTIPTLVHSLVAVYQQRNPTPPARINSLSLIQDILNPSSTESPQDYWRKSLQDWEQTLLPSNTTQTATASSSPPFHFHEYTLSNLRSMERKCQDTSTTVPTVILLAFARTLAGSTKTRSPIFGLFQAGRAASSNSAENLLPCLNVTPIMIHDATTRVALEAIQADLAARVPFEQSYLRDIYDWIGHGNDKPLFNTFVNILGSPSPVEEEEQLLTPWAPGSEFAEDIAPGYRVPGRTAVDALDTSTLADENLFLDVARDVEGDCARLVVRCDDGLLGESEAQEFVDGLGREIGRVVGGMC